MITFQTENRKLIKVLRDGAFLCWMEQNYRKPPGIMTKGYTYWSATVAGKDITADTLTALKAKLVRGSAHHG